MPSTFFIKDILTDDQHHENKKRLFSPISLITQQPQAKKYKNDSSSSSPTSTTSSTSTQSSLTIPHDQLLSQFYSQLLYYNYQKFCNTNTNANNNSSQDVHEHKRAFKKYENTDLDESTSCSSTNTNDLNDNNVSPLDALLQMATTTFVSNSPNAVCSPITASHSNSIEKCHSAKPIVLTPTPINPLLDIVSNSIGLVDAKAAAAALKRKRKNRTAFTAHQIYELEKRFAMQRYLSPTDRDRISKELCLSSAQVITWFQNRRAKQKRDLEELKNDVIATKTFCLRSTTNSGGDDDEDDVGDDDDDGEHSMYSNDRYLMHSSSDISDFNSPNMSVN